MNRLIAALGVISALSIAGCVAAGPDEELSAEALRGRTACTHTGMCGDEEYCSVEDGDCFSNCRPGMACPAVCWGFCKPEPTQYCYSSRNCDAGEYCSIEDGDCLSPCPPGMACPAVCAGICKPNFVAPPTDPRPEPGPEPRKICHGSHSCDEGEHCSVEDGDCFSNCPPGRICPAVCTGFCVPDEPEDEEERACYSSQNCDEGEYCTTEDGDCDSNCPPGMVCPAVCMGVCAPIDDGGDVGVQACGNTVCGAGTVCCNASCGICTPPGWSCTQQVCDDVAI